MVWLGLLPLQLPTEEHPGSTVARTTARSELQLRATSGFVIPEDSRFQNDYRFGFDTGEAIRVVEHSAAFRKAAKDAWHATRNGTMAIEAGFSIDRDGRPGKIQTSMGAPGDAAHHLKLTSSSTAMGTLHVHNKFGAPTPSGDDINTAKTLRKIVYVASREGLYSVGPDGIVLHLFKTADWFNRR
jgi:hypothetical protein